MISDIWVKLAIPSDSEEIITRTLKKNPPSSLFSRRSEHGESDPAFLCDHIAVVLRTCSDQQD